MHDLTPAEAHVVALLCAGEELGAIAALQGVSMSTIRTQLSSAMLKVRAANQMELVRRFLDATRL